MSNKQTCDASQLLIGQLLVTEFVILSLVHECNAVTLQIGF